MKLEDVNVGMWVVYRPHPDAQLEDGEVTAIRGDLVMVRYKGDRHAKATYARDLEPGRAPWWRRHRTPTESELWGRRLPPTLLHSHLVSLHALLLHLGARDDYLRAGQHYLRDIAVFTRKDPR